jgi:toxin ParE1/3/4
VTAKLVVPRERALLDIEEALDHYTKEAGLEVALGFIDRLEKAFALLSDHPAAGSLRYAWELGLPELRALPVTRYPYLIFYLEQPGQIDVWRVLHGKRDIPAWLGDG